MKVLAYSVQTPGHSFPFMPILLELQRRGHAVVFALFENRGHPAPTGIRVRWLTWESAAAEGRGERGASVELSERFGAPVAQKLRRLIKEEKPDFLLVDPMLWGGLIAAEASGLPWASISHNPKTLRGKGFDPRGPGFNPAAPLPLAAIHRIIGRHLRSRADAALPLMNAVRKDSGLHPLHHLWDCFNQAPLTVAATSVPFEYPRSDWDPRVCFVGPLIWEPNPPPRSRPVPQIRPSSSTAILLAGSSIPEFGLASNWIRLAIDALAEQPYEVIATIPAEPLPTRLPSNFRAVQYASHSTILNNVDCVICHGGPGITMKALALGIPVVAVPFAYDRFEVARRVAVAKAGVMLPGRRLTAKRLRAAVTRALTMKPGAAAVANLFSSAGGATAAADRIEAIAARW